MTCWVTGCDTLGYAQALVNTLADMVPGMQDYSVFEKRVGPQALVDAMEDTLTEVEALTTGGTLGDSQGLNDLLGDTCRDIGQCAVTCRHAGCLGTRDGKVVSR